MNLRIFHHNGQLAEFPLDKVTGILLDGENVLEHLVSFKHPKPAATVTLSDTATGPVSVKHTPAKKA